MLKLRMHLRTNVPAGYPLGVPFGDDCIAVLALDKGDTATLVRLIDANHWARPFDDVLEVARRNTAEEQVKIERITLKGGAGEAVLASSGRWFAATHALWPERLLGALGRHGALVAAPNPHVAMAYAIEDATTLKAIEVLAPWVQKRVDAVDNAISPHLYWWRPGRNIDRLDATQHERLAELVRPALPPSSTTTTGDAIIRARRPDR
jgi:hypothetical protein